MLHTGFLISALGAFCGSSATQLDRPPKLDFEKGTDYIAWFNERVREGKTQNALERYGRLAQAEKDGPKRALPMDRAFWPRDWEDEREAVD